MFQGGAGGPLIKKGSSDNVFNIIGLMSFGKQCQIPEPVVHTRIQAYLKWIEDTVWPNE